MPAPSNQTAGTAIDLGALPASVSQDVHDAGTTYDVWYTVVAPVGSVGIGLFGFGALANPYKPRTRVYTDAGITQLLDTGTSFQNRPVQFGVVAGNTYWLRFTPNAGNPTPAILLIEAEEAPDQAVPLGSIAVNDDTEKFPLVLVSAIDGDDYNVLTFVGALSFPAGEAADILPGGEVLVSDSWNTRTKLFDSAYALIADLALDTDFGFGVIRACHGLNKFYVGVDPGGAGAIIVSMVSALGVISGTTYTLTGNTNVKALAANNAGTILYFWQFAGAPDIAIKTWDLVLDIAGPDLVATLAGYDSSDLLYLDDDTLLALYFPSNPALDVLVKQFSTAGALLNTYNIGVIGYPASTFPRLAQAVDNPDSFWIMFHLPAVSPQHVVFRNIKISDGSTLAEVEQIHYETGTYRAAETATPISRFGVSFSCPFWIVRTGAAATGTIIVNKVTDPTGLIDSFDFTAGGGLAPGTFSLIDGGSQTYLNVPAGSGYSIVETPDSDFITTYDVSNDPLDDNTNISVAVGETVTVTVTNTQKGTITVAKVTDPLDLVTVFNFRSNTLSPSTWTLLSENARVFSGLIPGTLYDVEEFPLPITNQSPTYLVSNGSPITAITVAPGENVTVLVLNQNSGGGLRKVTPGLTNDVGVKLPTPFFITAFLGDK